MPTSKNTCLHLFIASFVAVGFCVLDASLLAGERASIEGRVVGIHDGDSLTILTRQKIQVKVRLEGIDAPELTQPFGQRSKAELSEIVFGKDVSVRDHGTDRYNRTIGRIICGAIDVSLEMVKRGMAWRYDKYSKEPALIEAQARARAAGLGVWSEKVQVPPWQWRVKKSGAANGIKANVNSSPQHSCSP